MSKTSHLRVVAISICDGRLGEVLDDTCLPTTHVNFPMEAALLEAQFRWFHELAITSCEQVTCGDQLGLTRLKHDER